MASLLEAQLTALLSEDPLVEEDCGQPILALLGPGYPQTAGSEATSLTPNRELPSSPTKTGYKTE